MDILDVCLVLEEGTVKNKLDVTVQWCLCVGKKCQPFPLSPCWGCFVRTWDLGSHRHSLWFLVKGKEIWLFLPDKNTEETSRPENNFFFLFLSLFVVIWACQIGLLSALQVCGRHRRGCWDKEWGREEREVKKTLDWRHGVWEKENAMAEAVLF